MNNEILRQNIVVAMVETLWIKGLISDSELSRIKNEIYAQKI